MQTAEKYTDLLHTEADTNVLNRESGYLEEIFHDPRPREGMPNGRYEWRQIPYEKWIEPCDLDLLKGPGDTIPYKRVKELYEKLIRSSNQQHRTIRLIRVVCLASQCQVALRNGEMYRMPIVPVEGGEK